MSNNIKNNNIKNYNENATNKNNDNEISLLTESPPSGTTTVKTKTFEKHLNQKDNKLKK